MNPPEAEPSRRGSTADHASVTIFGHTHARAAPRRTTADAQKQGWDSRTKVAASTASPVSLEVRLAGQMASRAGLNMLQDTLIRAATARSSHAFSRASSDAGSVIDSISSTPRERGPSRSQQQHTLQAVASRLQHVQSGEMSYLQHQSLHKTNVAAIPDCWDSRHCSDTASWADGHLDWKQQYAADLSRHQRESMQALSQLSSSVQKLEEKLHEAMAWQVCSTSRHASARKLDAQSGKHSCSSSIAEDGLTSASKRSASKTSCLCLENMDADQIALANKAKQVATWVQQSTMADRREDHEPEISSPVPAEHSMLQEPRQEGNTAAALDGQDQLVSCHLTHQDSDVSVNICINAEHDSAEQTRQQVAQTRYSKWLTAVSVVEDASEQLKVRNHNPGPGAKPVSYAQLLIDCAESDTPVQ